MSASRQEIKQNDKKPDREIVSVFIKKIENPKKRQDKISLVKIERSESCF